MGLPGRLPSFLQLDRYGISPADVVRLFLHCSPSDIQPRVMVTPVWGASIFARHAEEVCSVSEGVVWQVRYRGRPITVIRSGMGAPLTGDIVLALACAGCETMIFTGSVGGLGASMSIGDLVVVETSVCGDGFSRYAHAHTLPPDCFLETARPHPELTKRLKDAVVFEADRSGIPVHCGRVFSTDSILLQFSRLDWLVTEHNCIGIDMETSATFKAAEMAGIKAAAVLQVSDLPLAGKSLFSGRTEEENAFRKQVRSEVLARALLETGGSS